MNRSRLKRRYYTLSLFVAVLLTTNVFGGERAALYFPPSDSNDNDSGKVDLKYPIEDNPVSPFDEKNNPIDLDDPDNITQEIVYDPVSGNYYIVSRVGDSIIYRPDNYMTFEEYKDYNLDQSIRDYWKEKMSTESEFNKDDQGIGSLIPSLNIKSKAFSSIFGGNTIDIRPSGSAELSFGLRNSKTQNPSLSERNRSVTTFNFDQRIQVNLIGNIGDKLKLTINYNTEATFDFENQVKVDYTGYEDEIIQKIEAGNVTLPLQGSLITGSQSLFGVKTELQFGKMRITSVFSQQKGQKEEIEVQGGAQVKEYEIKADQYDANKHYFLSQFFRDIYEEAMANPPYVASPVNITRIEVWITNTRNTVENTRNLIAFQDLGEANPNKLFNQGGKGPVVVTSNTGLPDNNANNLYDAVISNPAVREYNNATPILDGFGFIAQEDYQKVGVARMLLESEYTLYPQLGIISLNMELQPNQVLGVSFQYTYQNQVYQVGDFSTDVPTDKAVIVKMLKSSKINTRAPIWDLMMKNVYSIGAYQVERDNFRLDVWYLDRRTGVPINYIPEGPKNVNGIPLIQVMNMDKMDVNFNPGPDGVFDFLTAPSYLPYINPKNGKVFFPVLEPFGSHLHKVFNNNSDLIDKYAFDSLYTNTPQDARAKFPDKNRFYIKGKYQSSVSNEISLNAMQIPEGAVKVTAGGRELIEGQDYQVDYNLGRVKILNQGLLESGTPIKISLESNSLFNIQRKTLLATRIDYQFTKDFLVGGTIMNLSERPLTQKTSYGDEPISNTVWGLDASYSTEAPIITRIIDNLPGIDTKEKSTFQVSGEFAQFIPGHSKAIGKDGTAYIDDFEGSQSTIDLRSRIMWSLASIPQNQPSMFPEADTVNRLSAGFNRALFTWYTIDPLFFRNDSRTPAHIKQDLEMQSNHFMREVTIQEVFPNKEVSSVQQTNIPTLDLAFYPSEKGPFNYDYDGYDRFGNKYGYGINPDGTLKRPEKRWGGIQRKVDQQDFEALNIEFIQFWVMDPFNEDYQYNNDNGELYFNLGSVSEDVMRDGQNFFENGIPSPPPALDQEPYLSVWGRYTPQNQLVDGFDNDPDARQYQDVGLDGLRDFEEAEHFSDYAQKVAAIPALSADISQDNFRYYRDQYYDDRQATILERYKRYNGTDGNSPVANQTGDLALGSTRPDQEDINKDKYIEETESYWQYKVKINKADLNPNNIGNNYITDVRTIKVKTKDGRERSITWYQFKIPIRSGQAIGDIRDFRSIRFIRMFMRGFRNPVVLRFARLELIRGEWRKFNGTMEDPGEYILGDDYTNFDVSAVNIEENSQKEPVNYVLPPGIEREINVGSTNLNQLNEQAISVRVCELPDGQARAIYRNFDLDILMYNRIKMYVHGESIVDQTPVKDGELKVFIRIGSDFDKNYYEYEIPLKITPPGYYNPNDENQRYQVWPEANFIDISLSSLQQLKIQRNKEGLSGGTGVDYTVPYEKQEGNAIIRIVGNPTLNGVKSIMMGVRNPRQKPGDTGDDGEGKCAEVWFNELRLTNFNDQSGWAAIVRATTQMADFGTLAISGSMSTPGWGSIDKKVSQRQRETKQDFDIQTNLELGKFFGRKAGIKIPTYFGYSVGIVKPQFAPLAPDILFDDYVKEAFPNKAQQDSVRNIQQAKTERISVNFTNVRKEKTNLKKKKRFYDISNFALNYSFSKSSFHDFETAFNTMKNHRGGLSYNFTGTPKNFKPFFKVKAFRSKWLALLKEFNFYLLPKSFSFSTDINRMYNEMQTRNNNPELVRNIPVYVTKTFDWNRNYALRWDITRNLKFDFMANNKSLIREMPGQPDTNKTLWNETVWNSVRNGGTNLRYNHAFNVTWNVPLNRIPLTDWITSNIRYNSTYTWERAPFIVEDLGNTIQNTVMLQANGTINFVNLYNKSKYFKYVNQKRPGTGRKKKDKKDKTKEEEQPPDKNAEQAAEDEKGKKKKKKKDTPSKGALDPIVRVLMMVRTGSASYSRGQGIMLPGYTNETRFIGMNPSFDAPGMGFVFGQQSNFGGDNTDFLQYAEDRGWLVKNPDFNNAYRETYSEKLNLKLTVEPVRDFRIEMSTAWDNSKSYTTFNRYYDTLRLPDGTEQYDLFNRDSPIMIGNFTTSYNIIRTSFTNDGENFVNQVFEQFSKNRKVISERLGQQNPNSKGLVALGYYDGYGPNQAEVLIPAFLAAYSGKDAQRQSLDPFSKMYIPDVRITYTGLSKIPALKKIFRSVTLSAGYKSSLVIAAYQSNMRFADEDGDGFTNVRDSVTEFNFESRYIFQTITLREAFSPLINVDVTLKNSLQLKFEIKRDRTLGLSTKNLQVLEIRGQEYVLGAGYTFRKVKLPFQKKTAKRIIRSDLKLRADFAIRNSINVTRQLDTDIQPNNPTNGQRTLSIKFTADYALTRKLNLRFFFDYISNKPVISLSYPNSTTNAGFSVRFNLSG